jgi:rhamnulose-1-phosphate aldolase
LTAACRGGNIITIMKAKSAGSPLDRAAGPYLDDIAGVAAELSRRGWAEANAGNISVRLGASIRMRDLARSPAEGLCLLRFGAGDRSYSVVPRGTKPSSELPTHVAVHDTLAMFRHHDRVVVHTHPTALISLTHRFPNSKQLIRLLLSMHTEAPILLQDRLTATPFLPPGSLSLGLATARLLERFSAVIWPGHGIVAVGRNAAAALDLIELTEKASLIALNLGSRLGLKTGLSPAQQKSIRKASGLE